VDGVRVLLETTAGSGTALGARFEELAELRDRIGRDVRDRVGFCADTCHLFAAGYDLRGDFDAVWDGWDRLLGLDRLGFAPQRLEDTGGSRVDRHELVGEAA
jgi:deoxyribonuclease-4